MLAVVHSYTAVGSALRRLSEHSWVLAPEPGDDAARKYSVCYPAAQDRTHHLHIVKPDWGWEDLLLFRDYLRASPTAAREYADLKRRLAAVDDRTVRGIGRRRHHSSLPPLTLRAFGGGQQKVDGPGEVLAQEAVATS